MYLLNSTCEMKSYEFREKQTVVRIELNDKCHESVRNIFFKEPSSTIDLFWVWKQSEPGLSEKKNLQSSLGADKKCISKV